MKEQETEIKLRVDRPAVLKKRLQSIGATLTRRRHFEDNFVLDLPGGRLRRNGSLLRVRITDGKATLTYKGPGRIVSRMKSRLEIQTDVEDGGLVLRILELAGLMCRFRYQKFRTIYRKRRAMITIDETPIGVYMEIEGPRRSIMMTAKSLGFQDSDFITATYLDLFDKYRSTNRVKHKNMTFDIQA